MASDGGHLKINRKFVRRESEGGDPLWNEPRQWSRAEAWMYLLAIAETDLSNNLLFTASLRELAIRLGWSKSRVGRFLDFLEHPMGRIKKQSWDSKRDTDRNIYHIVNTGICEISRGSKRDSKRDTPPSSPPHTPPLSPTPPKSAAGEGSGEGACVPPALSTPEFVGTWTEFVAWRAAELKKPMTAKARSLMLAKLAKLGTVAHATASLRLSMENDWQGVFPDKVRFEDREDPPPPVKPRADGFEHFVTGELWSVALQRWVDPKDWRPAQAVLS